MKFPSIDCNLESLSFSAPGSLLYMFSFVVSASQCEFMLNVVICSVMGTVGGSALL